MPQPVFYSYAYPEPEGFSMAKVSPNGAGYNSELREFIFPYDEVRQSPPRMRLCLSSCKAAMRGPPTVAGGIVQNWNAAKQL